MYIKVNNSPIIIIFHVKIKELNYLNVLLARVRKDDDGPVVMLVSERLDQVNQIGVLHLFRCEDVPLVQLLHCPCPVNNIIHQIRV